MTKKQWVVLIVSVVIFNVLLVSMYFGDLVRWETKTGQVCGCASPGDYGPRACTDDEMFIEEDVEVITVSSCGLDLSLMLSL